MNMGMMPQGLAPGVEHGDEPDLGAEMPGIGGDGSERLGSGPEQDGVDRLLFWKAISATGAGSVKTTWKYGTGSSSACRSASQSSRAWPWHFGQCRLRQEL
jgi:hypothetical protein